MSFKDKVIIVTGASAGIGAATSLQFAQEGAKVVLVARNEMKLKKINDQITTGNSMMIVADVSKDEDAKRIINETVKEFGKIDVLINNAGFNKIGSIIDGTLMEAYDSLMNTNLRAVLNLTSLSAPYIIKTKGNIVNVSSVCSLKPLVAKGFIPYNVSKAGLDHFMRGAAAELAPFGVRVNNINPGPVKTEFMSEEVDEEGKVKTWELFTELTALKKMSTADEIAHMILFLASDKASSITGTYLLADNGVALL